MRKHCLMTILLLLPSLLLTAGSKKEQQQLLNTLVQVLKMEEIIDAPLPSILTDDEAASRYCRAVLSRTDEQYSQDTALVGSFVHRARWLLEHEAYPDEKVSKALARQGYDENKLLDIFEWARRMTEHLPRYSALTTYCEKQLQLRREALQQTMPAGQLVRLAYREWGSSRPTEVSYVLQRDTVTGQWKLNGREVADTVAIGVRALAERHEVYKCLSRYDEPPAFPRSPHVTGGPSSWSLWCQFEGGDIRSGAECMPVPERCGAIVVYLKKILNEICKNQQDQN